MTVTINGTTGIDKIQDGSIVTADFASSVPLGTKNLIINGAMQIAQRATSATGLTGAGYHTVDRFHMQIASLGTWTQTLDTNVPTGQGFTHSLKMQCTTADASPASSDVLNMNYRLEGQELQHLKKGTSNAESVTISFWVKSNKTGTYTLEIVDGDNSRQVSKAYTIDTADTWEKKTVTFDGDTTGALDNDNNTSLTVAFWLATGSDKTSGTFSNGTWASTVNGNRVSSSQVNLADSTSNYINITGVQMEIGDTATPFEHRPYHMELTRCQRYYVKWLLPTNTGGGVATWGVAVNTTMTDAYVILPTSMRTISPSLTVNSMQYYVASSGASSSTGTWSVAYTTNDKVIVIRYTHGGTAFTQGASVAFVGNGTTGYLALDGEL